MPEILAGPDRRGCGILPIVFIRSYNTWAPVAALSVLSASLAASVSLGATAVLVEGFEAPAGVKAVAGPAGTRVVVRAVRDTPYVTQGKQAGLLPPEATVSFAVSAKRLAAAKWLRIDTVALQPLPHAVRINVKGTGVSASIPGYVQPGSDTLAVPLAVARPGPGTLWPQSGVIVSLKNADRTALIVDNVRLEAAAAAPEGAVLLDYGPNSRSNRQVVWPGFAPGGGENDPIKWGSSRSHPAGSGGWPDPLGRDFVGPILGTKAIDSITLGAGTKSVSAWLWLTHYGLGYTQPPEYTAMFGRRALMRGRLGQREMLGPQGLLEGAGGLWTPQWFDQEYSGQFVQVVQVTAGGTKRRVDLGNCQLAAAVMVPLAGRNAMGDYVKQVQRDLARYRRQFVVGATRRVRCGVAPTDDEARSGAMVFSPPGGRGFEANWVPRGADRAARISITAAGGMDLVIALAVVPLQPARSFSVSTSSLRSSAGRILAFEKPGLVAYCVQRVPRVVSACVEFQPWVLVPPTRFRAEAGSVCMIVLKGRIRPGMQAGRYAGTLTIARSGLRTEVPLAIEILEFSVADTANPMIGVRTGVKASDFYRTLSSSLPPAQRVLETAKVRRQLLTSGVDALWLPGAYVSAKVLSSSACVAGLKGFPADVAQRGPTVFYGRGAVADIPTAAAKTLSLATSAKITRRYLTWSSTGSFAKDKAAGAALAEVEKGSAMMMLRGSSLLAATDADVAALSPWSALLITPDVRGLGKGIARAKGAGVKHAYLYSTYPDRYVCGFYSCAVGASGSYVYGVGLDSGGSYSGHGINGRGMLTVQPDGSLAPTLALMRLWQARSDYQLMKSCQALVKKHGKAAPAAEELVAVLKKIQTAANTHKTPYFSRSQLSTTAISSATMEAWRAELLAAAAKLLKG